MPCTADLWHCNEHPCIPVFLGVEVGPQTSDTPDLACQNWKPRRTTGLGVDHGQGILSPGEQQRMLSLEAGSNTTQQRRNCLSSLWYTDWMLFHNAPSDELIRMGTGTYTNTTFFHFFSLFGRPCFWVKLFRHALSNLMKQVAPWCQRQLLLVSLQGRNSLVSPTAWLFTWHSCSSSGDVEDKVINKKNYKVRSSFSNKKNYKVQRSQRQREKSLTFITLMRLVHVT